MLPAAWGVDLSRHGSLSRSTTILVSREVVGLDHLSYTTQKIERSVGYGDEVEEGDEV